MSLAVALIPANASSVVAPRSGGGGTDQRPPLINTFGLWTLDRMAGGELTLDPGPRSGPVSRLTTSPIRYRLAEPARQGRPGWYLVRLHVRLELRAGSGRGFAFVGAHANGQTGAQLEFDTLRPADGIAYSDVGLVTGARKRHFAGPGVEIVFMNYLPLAGVRGGLNELTFTLDQRGDIDVSRVSFLGDSGIVYSRLAPARLVLVTPDAPIRGVSGQPISVPVRIRNAGGRQASATVFLSAPVSGLKPAQAVVRFPKVAGGHTITRALRFTAGRPGKYIVTLAARTTSNRPIAQVNMIINRP
jgi:hypothetical protein